MPTKTQALSFDELSETAKDEAIASMLRKGEFIDRNVDKNAAIDFITVMGHLGLHIELEDACYDAKKVEVAGFKGLYYYKLVNKEDFKDHDFKTQILLLNQEMGNIRRRIIEMYEITDGDLINVFSVDNNRYDGADEDGLQLSLGSIVYLRKGDQMYQKHPTQGEASREVALYKDFLFDATILMSDMIRHYRKNALNHDTASEYIQKHFPNRVFNQYGFVD